MTGRRKGTPCACETDPCSCGSSKGKCIKAINNVSPDPNGDFNLKAGVGISIVQSGDDEITIINSATPSNFIAGNNIELNPSGDDISIDLTAEPVIDALTVNGDVSITGNSQIGGNLEVTGTSTLNDDLEVNGDTQLNGDLEVNGDIIQNGSAYETHAQQIYTVDDYIIMRDGTITALGAGDYSGFQVKKYDGTNDGRLVIDSSGTARVGDVGDEQPLLTRSESGSLTNGNLLQWNGTSMKAVDAGVNTSQIVRGSGNIGTDTKPVKVVNGVAVPISSDLATPFTGDRYAYMTFNVASTPTANQWFTQSGYVTVASGSPYFEVSGATIKVLQAGYYLIHARLLNSISTFEGISINGSNVKQNAVHGTEIVTIEYLAANAIVTAALFSNTAGNGTFDTYNGLNRLEIIRL